MLERAIVDRDGSWHCFYCGNPDANTIDHVTCRFNGGSNTLENLVISCWLCNTQKNTKPGWFWAFVKADAKPADWLDYMGQLNSTRTVRGKPAPSLAARQPPEAEDPHQETPHSEHLTDALNDRLDQAVTETEKERV